VVTVSASSSGPDEQARMAFYALVEANPGAVFTKGENVKGYTDTPPEVAELIDQLHRSMVCEVCGWDLTKHFTAQDEGRPPRRIGRIRGTQGGDFYCPYEDAPTT
jgi:hypothetical protein